MNDNKPKKNPENRHSRWVWMPGDVEIIKNPDQVGKVKEKPAVPAGPPSPDSATPETKKDDDRKGG